LLHVATVGLLCTRAAGTWTRFVGRADHRGEQNTIFVTHKGKIWLKTIAAIKRDQELLAWYG